MALVAPPASYGGHFSSHWELLTESRERLYLDEMDIIEQDIKSIQREIQKLNKSNGEKQTDGSLTQLESVLKEG